MDTNNNIYWASIATNIAYTNLGRTGKKPSVGCVIVKNNILLATGVTLPSGQHAESLAIQEAQRRQINTEDSTLFVTLEPCVHYGTTPPCVDSIIEAKIQNVVIGILDPDSRVQGLGVQKLMHCGINVTVLGLECVKNLYRSYFVFQNEKRPYITLKIAQSLDGKIATKNGVSKWITNEKARRYTNFLRSRFNGILIGANTLRMDSPMLNCRIDGLEMFSPKKFVASNNIHEGFISVGGSVREMLAQIYNNGVQHLLVEGGANIITQFIKNNIFDEIIMVQSPFFIGGDGTPCINGLELTNIPKKHIALLETMIFEDNVIYTLQNKKNDFITK